MPIANCQLKGQQACARVIVSPRLQIGNWKSAIGNSPRPVLSLPAVSRSNGSKGFTFIEVLFAVILLGIGFIMIAAVFPVAIQQTSAVSDETQGTALARDAIKKIQAVADAQITGYAPPAAGATNSLFQPTMVGGVPSIEAFSPNIMQALGSDSVFTGDRRFGWVGFYRRDTATSPFALVYIIALENPNFPNYVTKFTAGRVDGH